MTVKNSKTTNFDVDSGSPEMASQFVGRVVILLTGGAAAAALVENTGSLGDLPRALARLLVGGGGGPDYQLNSKVRVQAAS